MGTRLEDSATKKSSEMKTCEHGCPGHLRSDHITRVFERRGSLVAVILENIPASVCTVCGRAFFREPVARDIDRLLAPFHGTRRSIPKLPRSRVIVDFEEARKRAA